MIEFKDTKGLSFISLNEVRCINDTLPRFWGCELNVVNSLFRLKTKIEFEQLELHDFHEKLVKLNLGKKKIVDFISSDNKFQLKLIQSHILELHAIIDVQVDEFHTKIELSFVTDQTIIAEVISSIGSLEEK